MKKYILLSLLFTQCLLLFTSCDEYHIISSYIGKSFTYKIKGSSDILDFLCFGFTAILYFTSEKSSLLICS